MRAHPGAHCFVLIRFLFLMKSPHSTIFEAEPREAYQLMLTIPSFIYPVKIIQKITSPNFKISPKTAKT